MDVAPPPVRLRFVRHAYSASPLPGGDAALERRLGQLFFGRGLARALNLFDWPEVSVAAVSGRLRLLLGARVRHPCLVHDASSGSVYLLGSHERLHLAALTREELTILHVLLHSPSFSLLPGSRTRRALVAGACSEAFCSALPTLAPHRRDSLDFLVGGRRGSRFVHLLVSVLRGLGFFAAAAEVDAAHAGWRVAHGLDG